MYLQVVRKSPSCLRIHILLKKSNLILFPVKCIQYREQDSKLALKIKSLENATLTELGVRDLFHLIYPKPEKWVDKEKLAKYEEEKKAKAALEEPTPGFIKTTIITDTGETQEKEEPLSTYSPALLKRKVSTDKLLMTDEEKGTATSTTPPPPSSIQFVLNTDIYKSTLQPNCLPIGKGLTCSSDSLMRVRYRNSTAYWQ